MVKISILVIGDIHVGSIWALWHPDFILKSGNRVALNSMQKQLWKSWNEFKEAVAKQNIEVLFLNGDIIDGPAPKDRGRNLMSTELVDQTANAEMILREFIDAVKPKRVIMISGTDYHGNTQQDNEAELAKYLGATYVGLGPFDFKVGGVTLNISHGSGGSFFYRGTKMDGIGISMQLSIAGDGIYNARHIIQSHVHFRGFLCYPHQSIYIVPCWQAQTDYMRKHNPFKMVPNIGALQLDIEDKKVNPVFYDYPHPPRTKYNISGVSLIERNGMPLLPPISNIPITERRGTLRPE